MTIKPILTPIKQPTALPNAAQVTSGMSFEPALLLRLYDADRWEAFIDEWAQSFGDEYKLVCRLSGPGDKGLDVVAFTDSENFNGAWDSYQCKRYGAPLTPSDIWIELGKIIYFSFIKEPPFDGAVSLPRRHIFVSPNDVGLKLAKLLLSPDKLKAGLIENWATHCELEKLGVGIQAPLQGDLKSYAESFDFSIFGYKPVARIVEDHRKTPYHVTRFGASFPEKPSPEVAPDTPSEHETVYVEKLLDAYRDHTGEDISDVVALRTKADLYNHFRRQRELFYNAECLKGFARDNVPPGVFDSLSDDIFHGVIDTAESYHQCGLSRVKAVVTQAAQVDVSGNALNSVASVKERQGVCHQLANDDRLTWLIE